MWFRWPRSSRNVVSLVSPAMNILPTPNRTEPSGNSVVKRFSMGLFNRWHRRIAKGWVSTSSCVGARMAPLQVAEEHAEASKLTERNETSNTVDWRDDFFLLPSPLLQKVRANLLLNFFLYTIAVVKTVGKSSVCSKNFSRYTFIYI